MSFSENLKAAIEMSGITQRKLAMMTGLTEAAITRYIKGEREPRIGQAKKLSQALGISLDLLFSEIPKKTRNLWESTKPSTRKSSKFVCPFCAGIVYFPQPNAKKDSPRECLYRFCPHCANQVILEELNAKT